MLINKIKSVIENSIKFNPCKIEIRYNEPMKKHTTFKTGGPVDCWIRPGVMNRAAGSAESISLFCSDLLSCAKTEEIPVFILGCGANIVVSDKGIRGIVIDLTAWQDQAINAEAQPYLDNDILIFKSGTKIDDAVNIAADHNLSGFEFFAGMPGTIGGAVWMNARCYGREISDVLYWAEIIINEECGVRNVECGMRNVECNKKKYHIEKIENRNSEGFSYKKSPFQNMDCLILNAAFKLKKGDIKKIHAGADKYRQDRKAKGHYLFPSAGSVFKNNHLFGKPAGQIIDECGLKGMRIGGAQVAPFHGNIIINENNASASDIRDLTNEVSNKVKSATGFQLEPEILFIGEW